MRWARRRASVRPVSPRGAAGAGAGSPGVPRADADLQGHGHGRGFRRGASQPLMKTAVANAPRLNMFVSYHEQDEAAARLICELLRNEHDIEPWLRAWSTAPGRLSQTE